MTSPIAGTGFGVYEQVLREGNADDIRRFIDVEELVGAMRAAPPKYEA
jgi:hypothetical protein